MKFTVRRFGTASHAALALGLACVLLLAGSPASAGNGRDGLGKEGGLGAAAALATLVYGPVKLAYAGSGLLVGGLAWLLSAGDNDVAKPIFTTSIRGDYVITPEHLTGRDEIDFFGRPTEDDPNSVAASPRYFD